jgi:hypothetical protein
MYYLYRRTKIGKNSTRYHKEKKVSLLGCNKGFITRVLLAPKIPPGQNEPYSWHIDVPTELDAQSEYRSTSLVIDLSPDRPTTNLYEVMDVWGWSNDGWTPVMLRLNGLFVDDPDPKIKEQSEFVRDGADIHGPIYEFVYVRGTVKDGKLDDLWVPPGPLQAVVLGPEPLNYFFQSICQQTPDVLKWPLRSAA